MNRVFNVFRNYFIIRKCRSEAIKLKNEGHFNNNPGQLGLINEIIEKPEKHYKSYQKFGEMFEYVEYKVYTDQSAS